MIYLYFFSILLYSFCLFRLLLGFSKLPVFELNSPKEKTKFTIVIPFRNEEKNLPQLLEKLSDIDYPSDYFEIIFIDDESTDASAEVILQFKEKLNLPVFLLENQRVSASPKKDALNVGIKKAGHDWILTTDADCLPQKNWLKILNAFIQKENPVLVCAPVLYQKGNNILEKFQLFDNFSLQMVTMGSFGLGKPFLANGANFSFKQEAFKKVDGYSGNQHLASGDDIFLLEKMKKTFPGKVKFLKSSKAAVFTFPQKTWKELIHQRIRWSSKTFKQKNLFSLFIGFSVVLTNVLMIFIPFNLIYQKEFWIYFAGFMSVKFLMDYLTIQGAARFFKLKVSLTSFFLPFFLYSVLLLLIIPGSLSGKFSWKERSFTAQK